MRHVETRRIDWPVPKGARDADAGLPRGRRDGFVPARRREPRRKGELGGARVRQLARALLDAAAGHDPLIVHGAIDVGDVAHRDLVKQPRRRPVDVRGRVHDVGLEHVEAVRERRHDAPHAVIGVPDVRGHVPFSRGPIHQAVFGVMVKGGGGRSSDRSGEAHPGARVPQ